MTEPKSKFPDHPDFSAAKTTSEIPSFGDPTNQNIQPRAKNFFDCAQEVKDLNEKLKEAKERKNQAEELLIQTFDDAGLSQARIDGIGIFFFKFGFHASIVAENKSEGFQWIRDQGHEDLIGESVNANTFSSFIKELKEEDENIELPEFVNTYTKKSIGYRRK